MSRILAPRRWWLLSAISLVALGIFAACGGDDDDDDGAESPTAGGDSSAEEVTVGFLYVGSVDDGGYNQAAYQGQLAVEELPGVEVIMAENVPESAEAERVMEQMIQQGATIIFPTSFGHLDPALRVGANHPEVTFLHQGGLQTGENVGTYFGTTWEVNYLAGIAAGRVSETGQLGYVVAFPISQTLLNINAFQLGAASVNPDATTTVVFTASWCDPAKISEAVTSLADQGVDVLNQHQDCPAAGIQAAEAEGMWSVGYHVDGARFAPNGWITAAVWDWSGLFVDLVEQVRAGTYEVGQIRLSLADGVVALAPFGANIPEDVQAEVTTAEEALLAGDLAIFAGPITDQDGTERIAAGESPDPIALESTDWLVAGVTGTIPN